MTQAGRRVRPCRSAWSTCARRGRASPSPSRTRPCRRCSGRGRRGSSPSSPAISSASSTIARTGAPVRLAIVDRVAEVVGVAVGEQDRVGARRRRRRRPPSGCRSGTDRRGRVVPSCVEREGRVAQEADVHRHRLLRSSVARGRSSCASSNPTATPTSMPSRVSSATSVADGARALVGVLVAAASATCASWASPNQPPSCSACVEDALQAGRGVRDDLLRVAEALGVGRAPRRRRRPRSAV